jgi:hypothetical protein
MTLDDERAARLAGERAMAAADLAIENDDGSVARAGFLAAAGHYRRAAVLAAAAGDDGARRADEAAALAAMNAAGPIASE